MEYVKDQRLDPPTDEDADIINDKILDMDDDEKIALVQENELLDKYPTLRKELEECLFDHLYYERKNREDQNI